MVVSGKNEKTHTEILLLYNSNGNKIILLGK